MPPLAASTSPGLREVAPVKAPRSWPNEQLALEQGLGQAGAIDHHEGMVGAPARLVHRVGDELLAGARLALQQHARIRRGDPRDQLEHRPKGLRLPDQAGVGAHAARHRERLHLLDEPGDLAAAVAHRRELDVHIRFAAGRVMQVQHTLALTRRQAARERAGLARAVARHGVVMGDVVAGAPDHRVAVAADLAVGGVGRDDAVVAPAQDVRLGQGIEEGNQLRQGAGVGRHCCHSCPVDCQQCGPLAAWQSSPGARTRCAHL